MDYLLCVHYPTRKSFILLFVAGIFFATEHVLHEVDQAVSLQRLTKVQFAGFCSVRQHRYYLNTVL